MGDVSLTWQHFLITSWMCFFFFNFYLSFAPTDYYPIPSYPLIIIQFLLPTGYPKPQKREVVFEEDLSFIPADLPAKKHGGNLPNWDQESQNQGKQLFVKIIISAVTMEFWARYKDLSLLALYSLIWISIWAMQVDIYV